MGEQPRAESARLRERAVQGPLPAVLVLPSQQRDGRWFYSETDVEALKVARAAGIDAEYLDSAADRRYLAEYSSGVALDLAFAVAANLTADGLIAVGRYVLAQLDWLRHRGLVADTAVTQVRIRAEVLEVSDDRFYAESLEISATGSDAVPELLRLLQRGPIVEEALRSLTAIESPRVADADGN